MDINIPVSNKIPEEREIAVDLSILKELMGMSNGLLANILMENEQAIEMASYQKNTNIETNLLFKLYFFANEHWAKNSVGDVDKDDKLTKIRCTRRLRDACKKEISKRSMSYLNL